MTEQYYPLLKCEYKDCLSEGKQRPYMTYPYCYLHYQFVKRQCIKNSIELQFQSKGVEPQI